MIHYDEHRGLSDLPDVVKNAIDDLTPHASEFDSVAAQGASGLIIASPVAIALEKPLVIARSDADMNRRHCVHISTVENAAHAGARALFIDDYVGEGKVWRDVTRKIRRYTGATVTAAYQCLYRAYTRAEDTITLTSQIDDLISQVIGNRETGVWSR